MTITAWTRHANVAAAGLMAGSALLFALMGVLVKLVSAQVGPGEVVAWRSAVGVALIGGGVFWRGGSLATSVPAMHAWRCLSGVIALVLWFYAIAGLPLATAMTLNYMSSVWMALFLIGGAVLMGAARVDGRLVAAVLAGFVGVALVLRPSFSEQSQWHALAGLFSGVLAAMAYLQVTALGRAGEPDYRIVFYFSLGGLIGGGAIMAWTGPSTLTPAAIAQLLVIGLLATGAQLMLTRAYAVGHTLVNAALQYLGIVFGFLFGALIFDEPVTAYALAGVALIVTAGMVATFLRHHAHGADARPAPANDL